MLQPVQEHGIQCYFDLPRFLDIWFLQIYRVSDMELVRVLPSAEDEVNVACFHPLVGGGLVYGTKVKKNKPAYFCSQ